MKQPLLPLGLLVVAGAQIVAYYTQLPDFAFGAALGIGIGLALLSFAKRKSIQA